MIQFLSLTVGGHAQQTLPIGEPQRKYYQTHPLR